jgi:hypothetical protein
MHKISFKDYLVFVEDQSAQGLMGTSGTVTSQPKPSDWNGKTKIDNGGCRGGAGVRRGGSTVCPDIDASGQSGGPGPKKGSGGGASAGKV